MVHIYKKNEILPFATTWKNPEGLMLSGISHTKTILCIVTYMWNLKNKMNEYNKTDSQV